MHRTSKKSGYPEPCLRRPPELHGGASVWQFAISDLFALPCLGPCEVVRVEADSNWRQVTPVPSCGRGCGDTRSVTMVDIDGPVAVAGLSDYATDGRWVLYCHEVLDGADAVSFTPIPPPQGKEGDGVRYARKVYYEGTTVYGADPASFRLVYASRDDGQGVPAEYAIDRSQVWFEHRGSLTLIAGRQILSRYGARLWSPAVAAVATAFPILPTGFYAAAFSRCGGPGADIVLGLAAGAVAVGTLVCGLANAARMSAADAAACTAIQAVVLALLLGTGSVPPVLFAEVRSLQRGMSTCPSRPP